MLTLLDDDDVWQLTTVTLLMVVIRRSENCDGSRSVKSSPRNAIIIKQVIMRIRKARPIPTDPAGFTCRLLARDCRVLRSEISSLSAAQTQRRSLIYESRYSRALNYGPRITSSAHSVSLRLAMLQSKTLRCRG